MFARAEACDPNLFLLIMSHSILVTHLNYVTFVHNFMYFDMLLSWFWNGTPQFSAPTETLQTTAACLLSLSPSLPHGAMERIGGMKYKDDRLRQE